jgi:hypothetical protein
LAQASPKHDAGDVDITLWNKSDNADLNPTGSWKAGGWCKFPVAAGAVCMYQEELRIVGRGILARAKLLVKKYELASTGGGRRMGVWDMVGTRRRVGSKMMDLVGRRLKRRDVCGGRRRRRSNGRRRLRHFVGSMWMASMMNPCLRILGRWMQRRPFEANIESSCGYDNNQKHHVQMFSAFI